MGILAALICLTAMGVSAQRAIPPLSGPVIDEAQILSPSGRAQIDSAIRTFAPVVQIQVWTLESLDGEAIESLSIRAAEKWQLGSKEKGDGLIVMVAMKERRTRIEVGQGIEDRIPDILARRILADVLKPALKAGRADQGLLATVQELGRLMSSDEAAQAAREAATERPHKRKPRFGLFILFLGFIIFVLGRIDRMKNHAQRGLGYGPRGGGWGTGVGGGGSGWGSGGGGGWSGGGGGFSGGGSSGDF